MRGKGQVITFDGHILNDLFYTGEVEVGLPSFQPDVVQRVGAHGSIMRSTRMEGPSIVVPLVVKPRRGHEPREAISALLSWLDVDGPKALTLSDDDGLVRMVVPDGTPDVGDHRFGDRLTIEFTQLDPWLYGESKSATVPSGGSVAISVGGDFATPPTVSASAAIRNSSSLLWGVRLDNADYLRVKLPTSSATAVSMNCGARTCTVGGDHVAPTLQSDWLSLSPGQHVIRNDVGSGAATVAWVERWHR